MPKEFVMVDRLFALSPRSLHLMLFVASLSFIAIALVMEHWLELEPCPLCILQRVGVIALGVVALVGALHNPGILGHKIYSGLGIIAGLSTIGVAARQLWLQSLPPDQVPACGPSLDYLMDVFPLMDVLQMILSGDGSCAEVSWQWLGISIPGWVVIGCLPLLALQWLILRRRTL